MMTRLMSQPLQGSEKAERGRASPTRLTRFEAGFAKHLEIPPDDFIRQGHTAHIVLAPRSGHDKSVKFGRIVADDISTAILAGCPIIHIAEDVTPAQACAKRTTAHAIAVAAKEEPSLSNRCSLGIGVPEQPTLVRSASV